MRETHVELAIGVSDLVGVASPPPPSPSSFSSETNPTADDGADLLESGKAPSEGKRGRLGRSKGESRGEVFLK